MIEALVKLLKTAKFKSKLPSSLTETEDVLFASVLAYMHKPGFLKKNPLPPNAFLANMGNTPIEGWLISELRELAAVRRDSKNFVFNFLNELADVVPLALELRQRRATLSKETEVSLGNLIHLGLQPGLGTLFFKISNLKQEARSLLEPTGPEEVTK